MNEEPSLAMDLTLAIVKLWSDTKGNIEKKLGDLANIAIGYWPFYIVPINDNNAYLLEGKGIYSEKIKKYSQTYQTCKHPRQQYVK